MSYIAFVIGNLASGKSTASRYLSSRGARHIDLDRMAKELYVPGSDLTQAIADEFGWDVLDEYGDIRTSVLAERAFATPETTHILNDLVHPVLIERLSTLLLPIQCCSTLVPSFPLTVVEVSAPAAFSDAFGLADEVIAVSAPLEVRRERAIARGMSVVDFDARASVQPSEDEIIAMADYCIDNTRGDDSLFDALDAWVRLRGIESLHEGER